MEAGATVIYGATSSRQCIEEPKKVLVVEREVALLFLGACKDLFEHFPAARYLGVCKMSPQIYITSPRHFMHCFSHWK